MLIVMTSPDAVLKGGKPDPAVVKTLVDAKTAGHPVALISNRAQPLWFDPTFAGTGVQFLREYGRQNGKIVSHNAKSHKLNAFDVLVLASKDEDVQMGKNGGGVLVAAGWSTAKQVVGLGIKADGPQQLAEVINLTAGWTGHWWYEGNTSTYAVRALADLSTYGASFTQAAFGAKVKDTVKHGGSRLSALLAVTARSLLVEDIASEKDLVFGVYPSSASNNDDDEVLSDFTHRLRTTVSRVHYCSRGAPLFIRHKPSTKRSAGGATNRTDPTGQVLTLHLNPYYREKGRLVGKHVIVVDDCTTYGVSFGVAAAFLRQAGATKVTGVALGKFGSAICGYDVKILTDPYAPISATGFTSKTVAIPSKSSSQAQLMLKALIP